MNSTWLKFILLIVMFAVTFGAGMVPVKVLKILRKHAASASTSAKQRNVSLVLCLLTCFSGGVFFATCFLHLFPELTECLNEMKQEYGFSVSYPLAELLSCIGFFLLFFVEEVILLLIPGAGHLHGPTGTQMAEGFYERNHDADHCCHENVNVDASSKTCLSCGPKDEDLSSKGLLCATNSSNRAPVGSQRVNKGPDCGHHVDGKDSTPLLQKYTCGGEYGTVLPKSLNQESSGKRKALTLAEPEACERNCDNVKEDPPILMKSRPHAHSHGVRSITFILAISFHSIIEGLAFGVQTDNSQIVTLFISLMVHKIIVAFSVGLQLGRTHAHALGWVCLSMGLFSIMSPFGGFIGTFVQSSQMDTQVKALTILIFQGVAVGTFIYVTFFEVLLHERDNEHPNLLKLIFMLIGFALIGGLRFFDTHFHEHSHGSLQNHGTFVITSTP
ncbi:ZIP Zinc transporter family protein [Acanthocheilonema viteae]